jgi:hypothetical protein
VVVVRAVHHGGALHFIVDCADGTRSLLPQWMTEPSAASLPLVEIPTLPVAVLKALRVTINARLLSSASFEERQEVGGYVDATPKSSTGSVVQGRHRCRARKTSPRHSNAGRQFTEAAPERVRPGIEGEAS